MLDCHNQTEDNEDFHFRELVENAVILFAVLGASRKQALFTISVDNVIFENKKVIFLPNKTQSFIMNILEIVNYVL